MFFNSWWNLARTLIVGVLAYAALVALVRISGKRTLSKMNAFDLIVTVALGSTLATVLLSSDVALAEGVLGFAVLVFLQLGVAWVSARSRGVRRMVKSEPRLLLYRGEMLERAILEERVNAEEVRQAVRSEGFASLSQVEAVVLETDGTFSVVGAPSGAPSGAQATALEDVEGQVPEG